MSKRESREVSERLPSPLNELYDWRLEPVVKVEITQKYSLIICKRGVALVEFRGGELYVPALTDSNAISRIKGYVVVDEGAVRYVVNGANVMRPGVVEYSSFSEGSLVVVKEPVYKRVIAVGYSMVDSSELEGLERGAVVKNVHYLRDPAWNALKTPEVQNVIRSLS